MSEHDDGCTCGLHLGGVFRDADAMVAQVVSYSLIMEAASSVALSHRPDCVCIVCRAARGDEDALLELLPLLGR